MDDQEEQPRELRELQEERHNLKKLQESAPFKFLVGTADSQIKTRTDNIILRPLANLDEALAQEYAKGEVAGIRLFTQMVPTLIETLDEEIAELIEKENENATSTDDDETPGP